jgi:transposase-like protein
LAAANGQPCGAFAQPAPAKAGMRHLQLDELVTKVHGVKEQVFVWVALDAHTKLILVICCGGRTRIDAQLFVHELWSHLAQRAEPFIRSIVTVTTVISLK